MNNIDLFCIFILIVILLFIFKIEFNTELKKENFELQKSPFYHMDPNLYRIKHRVNEDEQINSKYMRDESNLKTEVLFYINNDVPTLPVTPVPSNVTCGPCTQNATCSPQIVYIPSNDSIDQAINVNTNSTPSIIDKNITTTPPSVFSRSSLQYYYTFEDAPIVNNTLINTATSRRDAIMQNATIVNSTAAIGNSCLYLNNSPDYGILQGYNIFNKNSQYVKCPDLNTYNYQNGLSICIWMKPIYLTPSNNSNYTCAITLTSNYGNISIGCLENSLYYSILGTDSRNGPDLPNNTWSHIVWTISSTGVHNLYMNGYKIQNVETNGVKFDSMNGNNIDIYKVFLGLNTYINNNVLIYYYFNGYIDEVRIYNRVLSHREAYDVYMTATNEKLVV